MTERALGEMMTADLSDLDLVAVMIDGVRFAEHLCVVALGISLNGTTARRGGGRNRERHGRAGASHGPAWSVASM